MGESLSKINQLLRLIKILWQAHWPSREPIDQLKSPARIWMCVTQSPSNHLGYFFHSLNVSAALFSLFLSFLEEMKIKLAQHTIHNLIQTFCFKLSAVNRAALNTSKWQLSNNKTTAIINTAAATTAASIGSKLWFQFFNIITGFHFPLKIIITQCAKYCVQWQYSL